MALLLMVAMPMMAERVVPEKAQKAAQTFFNNNGVKTDQQIELVKAVGFPNLYIFNAAQGFVVMSADDCVQPILGYSLTGRFVAEGMPSNVSHWLQGYNDEIQYVVDSKLVQTAETAQLWNDLLVGNAKAGVAITTVEPLVQTHWDQNPYYNALCPYYGNQQTVTGCVATAMAQIMKYWNYPTTGNGSHSYTWNGQTLSANFGSTTYQWASMPNQLYSNNNAVATLMYHCGVAVDMVYGIASNGGSGAQPSDVPNALVNYFRYSSTASLKYKDNYSQSTWISFIKADLDSGMPVAYNGYGDDGGHAFVCDGYNSSNYFHSQLPAPRLRRLRRRRLRLLARPKRHLRHRAVKHGARPHQLQPDHPKP